jgi:hypothetical protein
MIVLRNGELAVTIDPDHGAEIVQLISLPTGRQLLGRPPFFPDPPVHGDIDEVTWTNSYRGGWQLLAPNAGNACRLQGIEHGFHGMASVDRWEIQNSSDKHAHFAWSGHGLRIQRIIFVHEDRLIIHVKIAAEQQSAAFIATEHITFGLALLEPCVEIVTVGGSAREMSVTSPTGPQPNAWPFARLLDGELERCDSWPSEKPRSRLLCISDMPQGRIALRNGDHSLGAAIQWPLAVFPYCWIWHENRSATGIWEKRAQILGLEPSMSSQHCGLGQAVENGEARWLTEGESIEYSVSLRVLINAAAFNGFVESRRAKSI